MNLREARRGNRWLAMLRGVMGFYTNKAAGGTTTIQTGQHATTNVMEGKTS